MTPLLRMMQPATHARTTAHEVHYEAPDGQRSLCQQANVFTTLDGEKMRVWYRSKRLVTCKSCIKAMEIRVRKALAGLNGDELEDILAHIDTFKSRYGGAVREDRPGGDGRLNGLA